MVARDALEVAASRPVVLVHGGGNLVDEYSRRMGLEPRYLRSPSGIVSRYTGPEEIKVYTMVVAGLVAKTLTARLAAEGVRAVSLAGPDCSLLVAKRKERIVVVDERGRKRVVDGGYTGRIVRVNTGCIRALGVNVDVVVVSPLAVSETGDLLNVDGDQAASAIASALKADALLLLTDAEGVIVNGEVVRRLTPSEAEELSKRVGKGMNRKLLMAARAVKEGVRIAGIGSALKDHPVRALLEEGQGTLVTANGKP